MSRYDRQRRVLPSGGVADDRLAALRVLLVGVGGIGAPLAIGLVRAGVGQLTLVDPDVVSDSDLPRQPLYFPEDVRAARPKAEAAARELARIGGRSRIVARSIALTPANAADLVREADLVVDATDHLAAREWIDAACRTAGTPWVHTAALGDEFRVLPFFSPGPPCFRCYVPEAPPAAVLGTCESAGVLPAATALAAAHSLAVIWDWLGGGTPAGSGSTTVLRGRVGSAAPRTSVLLPDPECPVCGGSARSSPDGGLRLLCGRRRAEGWPRIGAEELRRRLSPEGGAHAPGATAPGGANARGGWRIFEDASGLRAELGGEVITLMPDGRLLYGPTEDVEQARSRLLEVLGPDALFSGPSTPR